ncbi:MAG TPA: type III PLP-dependent enzyme [Candidatus Nanopelagicaceae bacterium]|nr:type III PLP-dependent enzyme [Candidatus Nanopelagicaceae bacterium]
MTNKSKLLELSSKYGTPLLVIDHEILRKNFKLFCSNLPLVRPYYAIKANPESEIVRTMYKMGSGFDVASWEEFMIVNDVVEGNHKKKSQFMNENVIYANPVKRIDSLKKLNNYFLQMTFDNYIEIEKVAKHCKHSRLILRIDVPNTGSVVELSTKFGAPTDICIDLIKYANRMGFKVEGLSFHVGSQCSNFNNYVHAFKIAHDLFEQSKQIGNELSILDIGGGFPVPYDDQVPPFEELAKIINDSITQYFDKPGIKIIAEPGRFFAATSAILVAEINGKATRNDKTYYYINDGVYNTFSGVIFDHIQYHFKAFKGGDLKDSAVVGPTCDALDKISLEEKLPDLDVEDLLYSENVGAYTNASATHFNGFPPAKILHINT